MIFHLSSFFYVLMCKAFKCFEIIIVLQKFWEKTFLQASQLIITTSFDLRCLDVKLIAFSTLKKNYTKFANSKLYTAEKNAQVPVWAPILVGVGCGLGDTLACMLYLMVGVRDIAAGRSSTALWLTKEARVLLNQGWVVLLLRTRAQGSLHWSV